MVFCSFLPTNNSAGEYLVEKGVERHASMAICLSPFSICSLLSGLLAWLLSLTGYLGCLVLQILL